LRGERADVTDFFLFSWPWWMGSVVKHNMLKFIIFNLFYLHFCFGPKVCIGDSSLGIFGVVPWRGTVRNITLLHTSYFHHTSLKTFRFTPFAVPTRHFSYVTVTDRDRPTFVDCCPCL